VKGNSTILIIDSQTGRIVQQRNLAQQFFGEGVRLGRRYLRIYDRFSLRPIGQFTYSGAGWGRRVLRKRSSPATALLLGVRVLTSIFLPHQSGKRLGAARRFLAGAIRRVFGVKVTTRENGRLDL
jgi:hypothetical protein